MRRDAYRVDDVNGMTQIMIDIKPRRCDSDVYIDQEIDVTNLVSYIKKKKEEDSSITYFHAFVTAMAMTIYNRRKLNRFIANRHVWEHKEIVISFVAKVEFDDNAEEMMIMVPISDNDNINTISEKIKNKVSGVRSKSEAKKGANSAIDVLGKLPNIIRIPVVGFLKWMDDKGMLPASLIQDNLYYSSMIVSNLGSIKCGAIYHNITNFGTCSSLATIGEIKAKEVLNKNNKKEIRQICNFGINLDERIADGYYFAKSIQLFQEIMFHPELLENNVSEKLEF